MTSEPVSDLNMENLVVETAEYVRSHSFGKYRGIVRDVEDDENRGRIKASVLEVYGDEEQELPWALPAVPFAGNGHGLVLLPEVDDGVWIEFEAGDIARPIWSGCWWARDELPEPGAPQVRVLATTGGHKIVLDDEENKIQLLHADGAELTMTDSEIKLKIGATQSVLSSSGVNVNNGAFEVK